MATNNVHSLLKGNELHYSKFDTINNRPTDAPEYAGQSKFDEINNILWIAIGASSVNDWVSLSSSLKTKVVSTASYTVTPADNGFLISLGYEGVRTITLPTTPQNGFLVVLFDDTEAGAYTYNITVNGGGAVFPGGGTSYIIDGDQESVAFVYSEDSSTWIPAFETAGLQIKLKVLGNVVGSPLTIQTTDANGINFDIQNTNAITLNTTNCEIKKTLIIDDVTVNSKKAQISLSGATADTTTTLAFAQTTNKTITFPDITDTLVSKNSTDIMTNKSVNNLKFNNAGNTFYTDIIGGNNTSNLALTLPVTAPGAGQVLQSSDTSGTLTWVTVNASSQQDVTGTTSFASLTNSTSLVRIVGSPSSSMGLYGIAAGTAGQILTVINLTSEELFIFNESAFATNIQDRISYYFGSSNNRLSVTQYSSVTFQYDSSAQRWHVQSPFKMSPMRGITSQLSILDGNVGEVTHSSLSAPTSIISSSGTYTNLFAAPISLSQGYWNISLSISGDFTIDASQTITLTIGISTDNGSTFSDKSTLNSMEFNITAPASSQLKNNYCLTIPNFYSFYSGSITSIYGKIGYTLSGGSLTLDARTAIITANRYL